MTRPPPATQRVSVTIDGVGGSVDLSLVHCPGEGSARCLLLHGNPGSVHDVAPMISPLRLWGDVLAYDGPGFGKSPAPASSHVLAIDSLAEVAVRVMDRFGWNDAVLVGHSHGGGVAQRVALRWPDRVRGLVLLGTLGAAPNLAYRLFPKPGVETLLSVVARGLPWLPSTILTPLVRLGMHAPYSPRRPSQDEVEDEMALLVANPRILRHMASVTKGRPWKTLKRDAANIRVPTVFVHGDQDRLVPVWQARALYDRMHSAGRDVHFELVTGAGHMLAIDHTQRCCEAVQRILSSQTTELNPQLR